MHREIKGDTIKPAFTPIITPPASVAFSTYSAFSFPLRKIIEVMKEPKTEESIARAVLIEALLFEFPVWRAALKDGQYIQRKIVPTIPKRFEW